MRQIIVDFGVLHLFGLELPLRIYGFGLMLVFGFITGILLAQWRARRAGEDPQVIGQLGVLSLLGGVLGARVAYVVKEWDSFARSGAGLWEILNITSGGLIYFGGLIGGAVLALLYMWVKRLPVRRFIDIVAPSLMIGLAFGRAGCLLNGCCWGGPCQHDWPLAVRFPMVSRPLLKVSGPGFYAEGQGMCPAYAEQFENDRVRPDDRLLNSFAVAPGKTHEGAVIQRRVMIPIAHLHEALTGDQLVTMFGSREAGKKEFNKLAEPDGVLSESQWTRGLRAGGFLRGSEIWDEAIRFDSPGDGMLSFEETWEYLRERGAMLLARFDEDGDGKLTDQEQARANAYLQADLFALLDRQRSGPLRPGQLLGIANALLLAVLLTVFYRYRRREGRVFALMVILYPITRFVLESIRNPNPLNVLSGDLTHNQITSIVLIGVGLLLWWWIGRLPASAGPALVQRKALAGSHAKVK